MTKSFETEQEAREKHFDRSSANKRRYMSTLITGCCCCSV